MTMDQTCSASSGPAGLVVQVCFPGVRAAVMDNLNRQREEGRLCDLSIQVQGQVFRAHRCVLAASSPYFHDQVKLHIGVSYWYDYISVLYTDKIMQIV